VLGGGLSWGEGGRASGLLSQGDEIEAVKRGCRRERLGSVDSA